MRRRVCLMATLLAVIAAGSITMGGCYRRVTRASGIGADQYSVSEPYQKPTRLDRWVDGDKPATSRRSGTSRLPQ